MPLSLGCRLLQSVNNDCFFFKARAVSENGRGMLTIYNVQESDQGAYTCEAMNSIGYLFAIPDAILIVIRKLTPFHPPL